MQASLKYANRWKTLAVLALSLVIIGLDNTILNVALPTLQDEFNASSSDLQWMVDSYLLVFAGLLLPLGALGDRIGRKKTLSAGLAIFGLASVAAALSDTTTAMIVSRAAMGVGGALIMPSTLSIVTDVFPEEERGKAIGVWAGMAAIGIGLGPLIGGALVEYASWQWVFIVNVPVVVAALALGAKLVPDSKDPAPGAIDVPGALLAVGSLTTLVYGLIEAPERGWFAGTVVTAFALAIVLGIGFVVQERRTQDPLLDVSLFRRRGFSLGSLAVSGTFFALFGMIFVLTQYLQSVQGASPLEAGAKMAPIAIGLVLAASNSDRMVHRFGAARVVSTGMLGVAAFLATTIWWEPGTSYVAIGIFVLGIALSMGNVMAPATHTVMSAVPKAKAGVGSAMNDVNRMVAGALGVAVVGSIVSSAYSSRVTEATAGLPHDAATAASDSVGGAVAVAAHLPAGAGDALTHASGVAFSDALGIGMIVAAAVVGLSALAVRRLLPDGRTVEPAERVEADAALPVGVVGQTA
jgi:EmrB/QacA subfamily drug resistance transporter